MINRRAALVGLGAGVGAAFLSVGALARRTWNLRYNFGEIGVSVEALSEATVRCTNGTVTGAQQEGPFYTPETPRRRDIRDPDINSGVLIVAGRVLDSRCQPIAGAVLDFWQTDHAGRYDNQGYRYRGHQYSDSEGRFELVTVRPHAYTAMSVFRTPHIHAKVQGRNTALLTTQLYLPDAQETNARDRGYDPALVIQYTGQDGAAQRALFDFVLLSV